MFFKTKEGEDVILTSVIMVDPVIGSTDRKFYKIHLLGGQHITVKENEKSRKDFIIEWMAANA